MVRNKFFCVEIWSDCGKQIDATKSMLRKRPSFIPRKHRGKLITRLIITVHGNTLLPVQYVATFGGYPNCHHVIYDYEGGIIHDTNQKQI